MGFDVIAGLAKSILGFFFDSPEVKAEKEKGRVELAKLELELKKEKKMAEARAEADYDTQAMKNMRSTFKDEYLIGLHTFPIWGYGIPSTTLHAGLDRIWYQFDNADYWWWLCYMGIIASTFGLRWLFSGRVDKLMDGRK